MSAAPAVLPVLPEPLSILVADASQGIREALAASLERADLPHLVHHAGDGPDLLQALKRQRIDLAFVDRRLPGLDGAAFVATWRGHAARALLVLLSDQLTPRWSAVASQVRAYEFLLKPFSDRRVAALVASVEAIRRPRRVLIVDAGRSTRQQVRRLLEETPFTLEVEETDSGAHAVKMAARMGFEMVLVDEALPDLQGLEVGCQIAKTGQTQVLLLRSRGAGKPAPSLKGLGIAGVLTKPFTRAALERAIHEAFGLWRPYLSNALLDERAGPTA
jgi:DNA-binding NtrC family response regulator